MHFLVGLSNIGCIGNTGRSLASSACTDSRPPQTIESGWCKWKSIRVGHGLDSYSRSQLCGMRVPAADELARSPSIRTMRSQRIRPRATSCERPCQHGLQ